MRKTRILTVLLCLSILFAPCARALEFDIDECLKLYSGMIGHIAFALPNAPQRYNDADNEGYWTGSVQLAGHCSGGGEYQFRTADISQWIDGMLEAYPEESAYHIKANTLLQYATFMILHFGGELDNMKASERDEFVFVSFTYTYPDTPGVQYEGRAFLENGIAVTLVGAQCEDFTLALERLVTVSEEEMLTYNARQPEMHTVGALTAVFPTPITTAQTDAAAYAACFSRDFSYLGVQYMPIGLAVDSNDSALEDRLLTVAREKVLPAVEGETVYDAVLSMPASDTALLTFSTVNTSMLGEEHGQKFLCRLYVGERGIYYVYAAATDTGAAFMDSLVFAEK